MQIWEYTITVVEDGKWVVELNAFGRDGWELVQIDFLNNLAFFKRKL